MGLFNFMKKQALKVIEWKDDSKNVIVYRYPLTDRDEIMTSSTLVVRESQTAIFVHKGQIADVFGPGTYKLSTENIPFLTKLLSIGSGFESPIKAEIYYINTKQFTGQKWGTQNPIMMRDAEFGNIRLRGFGIYAFKVEDPKVFMKELFGTNAVYSVEDVATQIKPMLIQCLTDGIAESKISALDLAANYREFSDVILNASQQEFAKYGIKLTSLVIENLSLPEEVEKILDERTKLGVLEEKMGTYTQLQAAQAMREAANNPNGNNMAGIGVGLGAGATIGNMFANSVNNAQDKPATTKCVKCGANIVKGAKFCSECGASQVKVCPKCKKPIKQNARFCSECGYAFAKKCPKCKKEIKNGVKFCSECGTKIED